MNLAQPGWLFLLLLLPLLGLAAVMISLRHRNRWDAFVAPRLRGALVKSGSLWPRWLSLFFLFAACALLIAALARPQGDAGTKVEKTKGRNILVALDLSRSMLVDDVKPDRLSHAKNVIYELLEKLPNDRIGLIGFAGKPFLYAPLTIDHTAVAETVQQIDQDWAPLGGSDLSSAVKLAIDTLKKTGQKNNVLVVISDGEETTDSENLKSISKEAESAGVYIYLIGVGTIEGGFVPNVDRDGQMIDRRGNPILSHLEARTMEELASNTKGRYVPANGGANIPALVEEAALNMDAFENEGRERRVVIEFYQWLLLPGILFLMISIVAATRWRRFHPAAALLVLSMIFAPQSRASQATDAKEALETKHYKEARESYKNLAEKSKLKDEAARYRIGEGLAAYRSGEFREARSAFSGAMLSEDPIVSGSAHFGLGNTLFQLGWQGLTDESYPADPAEVPDLERFETLVKERLAQMKDSDEESVGRSDDFVRMNSLIINWADAVRHFESSVSADPTNKGAVQNKETTLIYLRKLRELLEEEKKKTEQSMPQQGKGQPGEGPEGEDEGEGDGSDGPNGKGKNGKQGDGGDERDGKKGEGGDQEKKNKGKKDKNGDPNESGEDRARRILSDNADLEKGPVGQGRYEQRSPEKDY